MLKKLAVSLTCLMSPALHAYDWPISPYFGAGMSFGGKNLLDVENTSGKKRDLKFW